MRKSRNITSITALPVHKLRFVGRFVEVFAHSYFRNTRQTSPETKIFVINIRVNFIREKMNFGL